MDTLDNDIKFVAGVGEARAKLLERELGIRTLGDMLSHYPFRYIDRTRTYRISEITEAAGLSYVQFRARITGVAYAGTGRKRRFTAFAQDPTGQAELVWFQGVKWIEKRIEVGREYLVFGRPSFYRGELSVAHPELETMEQALSRKAESGMQGIYPSTEKLGNVLGAKVKIWKTSSGSCVPTVSGQPLWPTSTSCPRSRPSPPGMWTRCVSIREITASTAAIFRR